MSDVDREAFDFPDAGEQAGITKAQVAAAFFEGKLRLCAGDGRQTRLQDLTGSKEASCYQALKANGKFAERLTEGEGQMGWKPSFPVSATF